ncbi:MAG: CARDB domain-containing protein, partial [Thermoplasmata archaeon]
MEESSSVRIDGNENRKVLLILSLCSILLVSSLSIFPETSKAGNDWGIEIVDYDDFTGMSSSLAMDSQDRPHIAYYGKGNLRYAHWNGSNWRIQTVDSNSSVGRYSSISLDSSDYPHVSYFDKANGDLKYAQWNGSAWEIQTIDSEGFVGGETSIDIDSHGNPHIAYGDGTNEDLKYAFWNGTEWKIETVESDGDFGMFITMVLDSEDRAHISYYVSVRADVRYAHWTGSNWTMQSIDTDNTTGVDNSLALDSKDNPHITYHDYTNGCLKYAHWTGTDWEVEIVRMDAASLGNYVSLAIDSEDRPHIAYRPAADGRLLYVTRDNTSWIEEVIDLAPTRDATTPSIALDSMNRPHVSYGYELGSPKNLMYARTFPPPEPDLVLFSKDISFDSPSSVPSGTSVVINATIRNVGGSDAGNVYVRFYDGRPPSGSTIGADRYISIVPSEGAANASTNWTANTPGFHELCVFADPDNTIVEYNETNNMACKPIEVISSSIPAPPLLLDATLSGWNLENITLGWNLSIDDGEGSKSVVRYDVHRDTEYDPNGGYPLHDSVPNGTSHYVDMGAGEGDPSNYFYYVCAVNAVNNSSCSSDQAGKFTRLLSKGENLVSIP